MRFIEITDVNYFGSRNIIIGLINIVIIKANATGCTCVIIPMDFMSYDIVVGVFKVIHSMINYFYSFFCHHIYNFDT